MRINHRHMEPPGSAAQAVEAASCLPSPARPAHSLTLSLLIFQVLQERAGPDLQDLQARPDPAAPPGARATPACAGPPDPPDTVTRLSVRAFPTTGRDTEVCSTERTGCINRNLLMSCWECPSGMRLTQKAGEETFQHSETSRFWPFASDSLRW